jgi:hypothetical protein
MLPPGAVDHISMNGQGVVPETYMLKEVLCLLARSSTTLARKFYASCQAKML